MTGESPIPDQGLSSELTEDRWRRIEDLFHRALALPEDARAAMVEREAGADREMRRQIEEMLGHAAGASELLSRTVSSVARQAAAPAAWIGCRVGPYRLVREIGRGGMGMVFEAC